MRMQEFLKVKVIYDDGDVTHTQFNGSPEEATEYYIGTLFNFGYYGGKEILKRCVNIETHK
jgi:hypothetical protein